ncbi:hypothetical protein DVH05_024452 [Phytophthora capsici]|nr:hypothetical protein DVH05_024452 [Phytophthora capsici]
MLDARLRSACWSLLSIHRALDSGGCVLVLLPHGHFAEFQHRQAHVDVYYRSLAASKQKVVVLTPKDIEKSKPTAYSDHHTLVSTPKNVDTSPDSSLSEFVVDVQSREKNFVPVTLAFQDLWYSVTKPSNPNEKINLFKGIGGFAEPDTLTALMGSLRTGKATLMDMIAGRKTGGKITGKIILNGYEANGLAIRRCTTYCEMELTAQPSVLFLDLLFLMDMLDASKIMLNGYEANGLAIRRCTTYCEMELTAQPSVLFLDQTGRQESKSG